MKPDYVCMELAPALREYLAALAKAEAARVSGFRPMAPADLHCTFYFYGDALQRAPPKTRQRARNDVAAAGATLAPGTITVTALDLFPPPKRNLLVALLQVPAAWAKERLALAGADGGALARPDLNSDPWVAHVTLGKYVASNDPVTGVRCAGAPATAPLLPAPRVFEDCVCAFHIVGNNNAATSKRK